MSIAIGSKPAFLKCCGRSETQLIIWLSAMKTVSMALRRGLEVSFLHTNDADGAGEVRGKQEESFSLLHRSIRVNCHALHHPEKFVETLTWRTVAVDYLIGQWVMLVPL